MEIKDKQNTAQAQQSPQIEPRLDDEKEVVRLTAAAVVIHLQSLQPTPARHSEK